MGVPRFLAVAGAALLFSSGGAFAQAAITGTEQVQDRIEDIEEDTQDRLEDADDAGRFGFGGVREGFSGSLSISGSASSGNSDTTDVTGAGRLTYGSGKLVQSLGFGIEYSEADDDRSENEVFLTYGARRDITDRFYAFGLGRYEYDEFGPFEEDAFLGAGPGYRIVNTPDIAWRVQAGIGYRYLDNPDEDSDYEFAGIAASRLYYRLSEQAILTNDTDILDSDTGTLVTNDLGVNFRVTNAVSTRVSLRTEYNSDTDPGFDDTDNKVGFALVYGF